MTDDAPAGAACSVGPPTFVWTITREGRSVAIAESDASGTVAGDAMSGEWHVVRTSSGTCFGGGTCSAPVHGTRQVR